MPDSAGGRAVAEDATVAVDENPPGPSRRRLEADVAQCRRVVDELVEGAARLDAKADEVTAVYKAKQQETAKMVTAAKKALADAEKALKAEGN